MDISYTGAYVSLPKIKIMGTNEVSDEIKQISDDLSHTATVFKDMVLNPGETFSQCKMLWETNKSNEKCSQLSDLYKFSFLTVAYRTRFSYCYCVCGVQLEYFDYINPETGDINNTVLERIEQNISRRTCCHTEKVPKKFHALTSVYPINILAAVGRRSDVENLTDWIKEINTTGVFDVHPIVNAVLMNNYTMLDCLKDIKPYLPTRPWTIQIKYPIKVEKSEKFIWETKSLLEYCAQKENTAMLRHAFKTFRPVVRFDNHICSVYNTVFKYQLKDMLHILLWKGFDCLPIGFGLNCKEHVSYKEERLSSAKLSIVYDHPKMLDYVVTLLGNHISDIEKGDLLFISVILQRRLCRKVLFRHGFDYSTHVEHMSCFEKHERFIHFLFNYPVCGMQLVSFTHQHPEFLHALRKCSICADPDCLTVAKVQILTALGVFVDAIKLAKNANGDCQSREMFELWLYSNPSNLMIFAQYSLVNLCLKSDNLYQHFSARRPRERIEYILDGKEHVDNNVWNYALPLVIECGYKFDPTFLEQLVYNFERRMTRLAPTVKIYLKACLECPRSLQLCCRDTLRRHFKTNQIHQYMSISTCPKNLKDFVLLKTVLPTLKYNEKNLIF